jgi:hypothetical protein
MTVQAFHEDDEMISLEEMVEIKELLREISKK